MNNLNDLDPEFDIFMELYMDKEREKDLAFEDLAELMEADLEVSSLSELEN